MEFSISSMALTRLTIIFTLFLCVLQTQAADTYQLDTSYSGSRFFDGFDFFTNADPTGGFVDYVAFGSGYAYPNYKNGAAFMGVDDVNVLAPSGVGRKSVRISSQKSWTHGLLISDIVHMPGGICGVWPAHWTLGPNWPTNGEIDIIEGVNSAQHDFMSLHTSPGCTMPSQAQLGTLTNTNCDTNSNYNSGCSIEATSTTTYGSNFNANGGGVFATEWTSDHIKIWFFPRNAIPQNIINGVPDPSAWSEPQAIFQSGANCNIDSHFAQNQIIFDTTFCGDYGDATWPTDATCNKLATSCAAYVAGTPGAFTNAYWLVNSVKVYTLGSSPDSTSSNAPTSPTAIPTSSKIVPSTVNSLPGDEKNHTAASVPVVPSSLVGNVPQSSIGDPDPSSPTQGSGAQPDGSSSDPQSPPAGATQGNGYQPDGSNSSHQSPPAKDSCPKKY